MSEYRYEGVVRFLIAANDLREAHQAQKHVASLVSDKADGRVTHVAAPLRELRHRPDLDNSMYPWRNGNG